MSVEFEMPQFAVGKFAPKMSLGDQCAWFALHHHKRVPLIELAFAAGVHKGTMRKLCSNGADRYKRVHDIGYKLGLQLMYDTYVTEGHVELLRHKMLERAEQRDQKVIPSAALTQPSKAHNKKEGIHLINGHKIEIRWRNEEVHTFPNPATGKDDEAGGEGWYLQFDDNGIWTPSESGKPYLTSDAVYRFMNEELNR